MAVGLTPAMACPSVRIAPVARFATAPGCAAATGSVTEPPPDGMSPPAVVTNCVTPSGPSNGSADGMGGLPPLPENAAAPVAAAAGFFGTLKMVAQRAR